MEDLIEYQGTTYLEHKRELESTRNLRETVLRTLVDFAHRTDRWPKELRSGDPPDPGEGYSFSTNAMIMFALAVAAGRAAPSPLVPLTADDLKPVTGELRETIDRDLDRGAAQLVAEGMKLGEDVASTSSSFGTNDRLTLLWLLGLAPVITSVGGGDYLGKVKSAAERSVRAALEGPPADSLGRVEHAFMLLRALQIAEALGGFTVAQLERLEAELHNVLHLQLSLRAIADSEYDPGELVFALEGLLLSRSRKLDRPTREQAFSRVTDPAWSTPLWRPWRCS